MAADVTLRAGPRRAFTGWDLGALVAANGAVVVGLWWRQGGLRGLHDTAGVLTGLGRVTGLLGAYLALVELLLLARLPVLDRLVGLHRLTAWHRAGGFAVLALLVAHTLLITAGYTVGDNISLGAEIERLITGYPGVITATAGLVALIGVTVTSIVIVRRRLGYETWYSVHLYAYLGIVLAFSHQLATGSDFVGDSAGPVPTGTRSTSPRSARSSASGSRCRSSAACATVCAWRA